MPFIKEQKIKKKGKPILGSIRGSEIAPDTYPGAETVQDSIPILNCHDKANLIESYPGHYSRMYKLSEINYSTLNESEQENLFKRWRSYLNSIGSQSEFQLTIYNRSIDMEAFKDAVLTKERGDDLDELRRQLNRITYDRVSEGKNGIRSDKYITLSYDAENLKKAEEVFHRLDKDTDTSLSKLGSSAKVVPIEDRLDVLYDIYNQNHSGELLTKTRVTDENGVARDVAAFDFDNLRSMGLRVNDVIAPSSITYHNDYIEIGDIYARVLKVDDYPSIMSDDFLTDITAMDFNILATLSVKPIPNAEADKMVNLALTLVRTEKVKAVQRAQRDGGDENSIAPGILDREQEALELRDDMREHDERLFETTLTMVIFANDQASLKEYTDTVISTARKKSVTVNTMVGLQDDGFVSTLPLCYNRIHQKRTFKSSSVAALIPFSVTELNDTNGINYSMNAVTRNLILYDRTSSFNANGFILGTSGCVDCETEYFNGKEWKSIAEYQKGEKVLEFNPETGEATLVRPEKYIKAPCDKMYHFKTKYGVDQMLSPEHRVLYYNRNSHYKKGGSIPRFSGIKELSAEKVADLQEKGKFYGCFKTDFKFNGSGIDMSDSEIKLMLAVIADGHFDANNAPSKRCTINIKKDRKKEDLDKILSEYPEAQTNIRDTHDGYLHYMFYAPRREKTFLSYWYRCSREQLQLICDNVLKWDGRIDKNGRKTFSTSIKENADFVQFAFSACGYRAAIHKSDRTEELYKTNGKEYVRKSPEYTVSISKVTMISMEGGENKASAPEIVKPSDGMKYCFTVPTHALVLRRNGKIFVTGNSGKSFAAKTEMLSVLLRSDSDVIVIDPEREYGPLCEAVNGTTITVEPGSHDCINPMSVYVDRAGMEDGDPVLEKVDFILNLCETILNSAWGIQSVQETIIDECVHELYEPFYVIGADGNKVLRPISNDEMPTLTDLYESIRHRPEPEARDLSYALSMYTGGGSLNIFGGKTTVNLDNRFVVFDINALGNKLKPVAMQVVLSEIWNKIVQNRQIGRHTWFYVDEIYLLFKNEISANFLQELWKRARKYGGVPTGITQNVEDLLTSQTARSMLANSSFVEMLNQAPTDRDHLRELLHLSESQADYITDAPKGQGLIYTGSQTIPFYSRFPKDNDIYRCLTSDMVEIKRYKEEAYAKKLEEEQKLNEAER